MAVIPTILTSGVDDDGGATATTASITPTSNRPVAALIYLYHGGTDGLTSISGAGLTWTARASFAPTVDTNPELHIWTGVSASPSSGALTITPVNTTCDHIRWVIVDLENGNASSPYVQNATGEGTSTTATATLAALASATNMALAITWMGNADTMVPEAGYTELFDSGGEFGGTFQVMYRADNGDVTPAVTLGVSSAWAMLAVEIADSGGGGGGGAPGHGRGRELSSLGWGLSLGRNFVR